MAGNFSIGQCNLDSLENPPLPQEINNVLQEWQSRDLSVNNWQVSLDTIVQTSRIIVASHEIEGNTHYGLIRIPVDTSSTTCVYPALLYLHGGLYGISISQIYYLENYIPASLLRDSMIIIAPSYRSEPLMIGPNITFNSQGVSTELDKDADDALIFLNGAIENHSEIDTTRISAIGFSRGGNVAYRAAIRSKMIKAMNIFYAVSNFYDTLLIHDGQYATWNDTTPHYSINNLMVTDAMQPHCTGLLTATEARQKILSWSPGYFLNSKIPRINVFHGSLDPIVPINQSTFIDSLISLNPGAPDFQLYEFPDGTHSLASLSGFEPHAIKLFRDVIRPSLFLQNDSLFSTGESPFYQWYVNGSSISNAFSDSYYPTQSGIYQLEHIVSANCSYFSDTFEWIITNAEIIGEKQSAPKLFFDPVHQVIDLHSTKDADIKQIRIINMQGNTVYYSDNSFSFPFYIEKLNLNPGIYIFSLPKKQSGTSIRFVVL